MGNDRQSRFLRHLMNEAQNFNYDPTQPMNYDPMNVDTVQVAGLAQFDIKIQRLTANINAPLPVALFSPQAYASKYYGVWGDLLPVGGTVVVTVVNDTTLNFAWTVGMATDNIRVTCGQIPYTSFLDALHTQVLQIPKCTYKLSDASIQTQYDQDLIPYNKNLFGGQKQNNISPNSYRKPNDYLSNYIYLDPLNLVIKPEEAIITNIVAEADFYVTLSIFASGVKKIA